MRALLAAALIAICSGAVFCDAGDVDPRARAGALSEDAEQEPEPYTEEEFPDWLKALRRGEIIAFGSLPFTFAFSFLIYDVFRYVYHGFDQSYLPIGSPNPEPYTAAENLGVVAAAGAGSIIIAVVDALLGRAETKRRKEGASGDVSPPD